MTDSYSQVKGKCIWWRETPNVEDAHDIDIKAPDKRIECSCFVEGYRWELPRAEVPKDCPNARKCRYFVSGA